jgi:hypothetical protein
MKVPTFTFKTLRYIPDEYTTKFICNDDCMDTGTQIRELEEKLDKLREDMMEEFIGIADTFREIMSMLETNGNRKGLKRYKRNRMRRR